MGNLQEMLQASWPILLMVVIFYFLLYRPQKKQQKERQNLLDNLKVGAEIVTVGGMYGEIVNIQDDKLTVKVADKVLLTFARSAVANVITKDN
ncbi:MAG: preprotein translocase subunit YajC [Veillonella sp.]|nr:preprotein translocase subunit YajC [Veillonella sp.]MCF0156628.1 preprotein translocase subunit YajC [Veillonella sp.]